MRAGFEGRDVSPAAFRRQLEAIRARDRDAWLDHVLGLGPVPDDGPALPRGGVPYLPSPVAALMEFAERTNLGPEDLVVDLGAGVGRALAALHLLSGARGCGVEIQPALVTAAQALAQRLHRTALEIMCGDAAELAGRWPEATGVLLYCPFGGERLGRVLERLRPLATRRLRWVATIDLPLPACAWLDRVEAPGSSVDLYRPRAPRLAGG